MAPRETTTDRDQGEGPSMNRVFLTGVCFLLGAAFLGGQGPAGEKTGPLEKAPAGGPVLLKPARVFDGVTAKPHEGWVVLVRGERIEAAGPEKEVAAPAEARVIALPGAT